MKKKSYLLMLKVVLFHFKEKFKDEKKIIKQLVLAKNRHFQCGSQLILKNTFFWLRLLDGGG